VYENDFRSRSSISFDDPPEPLPPERRQPSCLRLRTVRQKDQRRVALIVVGAGGSLTWKVDQSTASPTIFFSVSR
jgi:hypothetical protein